MQLWQASSKGSFFDYRGKAGRRSTKEGTIQQGGGSSGNGNIHMVSDLMKRYVATVSHSCESLVHLQQSALLAQLKLPLHGAY